MFVAKQVADLITFGRAMVSVALVLLGLWAGPSGLPVAAVLMLLSWMSDSVDGPIARRSRIQYHTWIGDHDLEVDICVAIGLLIYLALAGFVSLPVMAIYAALWGLILWYGHGNHSLGLLFQAPIYGWFLWICLLDARLYGICMLVWIVAVVVITWPRFPEEVIPGFLNGLRIHPK